MTTCYPQVRKSSTFRRADWLNLKEGRHKPAPPLRKMQKCPVESGADAMTSQQPALLLGVAIVQLLEPEVSER